MNKNLTVKMNVLGVALNENQIDAVLDHKNKSAVFERDSLASFFQVDKSELTWAVLRRYAQADKNMARISVGSNHKDISDRLISTLTSAKRCYSNAEYIACIEMCALHGEMLANYLCITDKDKLDKIFSSLPEEQQKSIKKNKTSGIYFSDKLSQPLRLVWLAEAGVITMDDKEKLMTVHKLRIKYFHHWSSKSRNENDDAINALSISYVTAKYLEILGDTPRTYNDANLERIANLKRIDEYMQIVLAKPPT